MWLKVIQFTYIQYYSHLNGLKNMLRSERKILSKWDTDEKGSKKSLCSMHYMAVSSHCTAKESCSHAAYTAQA